MGSAVVPSDADLVPRLLQPLDTVRSAILRLAGPALRPFLRDRALRVSAVASIGVLLALVATVIAPRWLLLYGPLALGVPHIVADVRYLVVQPGAHRSRAFRWAVAPLLGSLLLWPSLLIAISAVGLVALTAPSRAPGARLRRGIVLAACALAALAVFADDTRAQLYFVHGHNLVAILFVFLFVGSKRGRRLSSLPFLIFLGASAALLFGTLENIMEPALVRDFADPRLGALAAHLAPVPDPSLSARLLLFYAFAQSVHYAAWLRVIPEERRPRPGVRGFGSSYRALRDELGPRVLGLATAAGLGLLGWAAIDAWDARDGYLRLAFFHGPLELAMLAWLFVRGALQRDDASASATAS